MAELFNDGGSLFWESIYSFKDAHLLEFGDDVWFADEDCELQRRSCDLPVLRRMLSVDPTFELCRC